MANYSTPVQSRNIAPPSVFMTPSSSCGKAVYKAPRSLLTTPVSALSFPSPNPEHNETRVQHPSEYDQEHRDILTGLYNGGYPILADQIISLLDTSAIHSSLRVSKSWNNFISVSHTHKVTSHAHPHMVQDENSPIIPLSTKSLRTNRTVLGSITVNSVRQRQNTSPRTLSTSDAEMVQPSTGKLRPCPCCGSPAKKLNTRRAECTKCHFDFCQHCFEPWHQRSTCGVRDLALSPKKSDTVTIAGTKKSKRRLKRL